MWKQGLLYWPAGFCLVRKSFTPQNNFTSCIDRSFMYPYWTCISLNTSFFLTQVSPLRFPSPVWLLLCLNFLWKSLWALSYAVCFHVVSQLDPSLEAKVNLQKQSVILEEEYEVSRGRLSTQLMTGWSGGVAKGTLAVLMSNLHFERDIFERKSWVFSQEAQKA